MQATLIDKNCEAYKDRQQKVNAWRNVDAVLGMEKGNKSFVFSPYLTSLW